MADAPQPSSDTKESDKKMRERVDKLLAQATSESSGSITLGAKSLEYIVNAAYRPVHHGEPRRAQENALGRRRCRRADRRRAGLADTSQALGLGGLPRRRKLRHDAWRRARR